MNIRKWATTEAGNQAVPPDGFPEGMNRSDLNDSSREVMAQIRQFWNDPSWVEPWNDGSNDRTYTWNSSTNFSVDGDHSARVLPGHLIKVTEGSSVWIGIIATAIYTTKTALGVSEWIDHLSSDTTGPLVVPDVIQWRGDLYDAAIRSTGTSPENVPTMADLDAHVTTPEAILDVGFLGGLTADEIAQNASLGNILINGDFRVWQRGDSFTSANVDNVTADCWTVVADESGGPGTSVVQVARSTDKPGGVSDELFRYSARLTVQNSSGNPKKSGLIQFVEMQDAFQYGYPTTILPLSVSFWAKSSGGISQIRTYLVNAKGATVSATPVSNYLAGSTGPVTLDAGLELVSSASSTVSSSWTRFTPLENIDMDLSGSGTGIIGLMILMDDASFVNGDELFIAGVQVVAASTAQPFRYRPIAQELLRCWRFYENTYEWEDGVFPGDVSGTGGIATNATAAGTKIHSWRFLMQKYKAPTVTLRAWNSAASDGEWTNGFSAYAGSVDYEGRSSAQISCSGAGANQPIFIHAEAVANIWGDT